MSRSQIDMEVGASILVGLDSWITLREIDLTNLQRAQIEIYTPASSVVVETDGYQSTGRWRLLERRSPEGPIVVHSKRGQSFKIDNIIFFTRKVTIELVTLLIDHPQWVLVESADARWAASQQKTHLHRVGSCVFWLGRIGPEPLIFRGIVEAWQDAGRLRGWEPTIASIVCNHPAVVRRWLANGRRSKLSWQDCTEALQPPASALCRNTMEALACMAPVDASEAARASPPTDSAPVLRHGIRIRRDEQ
jgi:hypothetical protein